MFFRFFLFISSFLLLTGISGCESGDDFSLSDTNKVPGTPPYDLYLCASIGGNHTYTSGIYGAKRGQEDQLEEIINLNGEENLVDDCAVDDRGNLYWTNRGKNGIFKANADGSNIRKIVSGLNTPIGLAIDETHQRIYWADWQTGNAQYGKIGYADLDGGNQKVIIDSLRSGGKLLLNTAMNKLYIADLFGKEILQSDMEGNNLSTLTQSSQPEQMALDTATGKLYWTDVADDAIYAINLNGTNKQTLISFSDHSANPCAIALDKDRLLFTSWKDLQKNILNSIDKIGQNHQILNGDLPRDTQKIIIKNQ